MGGEQQLDSFTLQTEALLNNAYCHLGTRWHYCCATRTQSHLFSPFSVDSCGIEPL